MGKQRLSSIAVRGMRTLEDVRLELDGFKVLIGENGSGKSTLIEVFELLRKLGSGERSFGDVLARTHGGAELLLRKGAPRLELAVTVQTELDDTSPAVVEYSIAFRKEREGVLVVDSEKLVETRSGVEPHELVVRSPTACQALGQDIRPPPGDLALHYLVRNQGRAISATVDRVLDVLARGRVHVPFETRPIWLSNEQQAVSPLREPTTVDQARGLERLGLNLINCYQELRERGVWNDCLDLLRLGFGSDLKDLKFPVYARGKKDLQLEFTTLPEPVSTGALSDGQLTYLAFVVLIYLREDETFLAIDEPETHLHPTMLGRVVSELERLGSKFPVIVATQSDRLLDMLEDAARSTLVMDLDPQTRSTRLLRLDRGALESWRDRYAGVGEMRAAGVLDLVTADPRAH